MHYNKFFVSQSKLIPTNLNIESNPRTSINNNFKNILYGGSVRQYGGGTQRDQKQCSSSSGVQSTEQ